MTLNPNLATQVLRYVQVSSVLGKRALDQLANKEAAEKAATEQVPEVIKAMKTANVIPEGQTKAAEQHLATHAGTMALLKEAVAIISKLKQNGSKKAGDLGRAEKSAEDVGSPSVDSLNSPFVGQRTSADKASDVALKRGLGLATA